VSTALAWPGWWARVRPHTSQRVTGSLVTVTGNRGESDLLIVYIMPCLDPGHGDRIRAAIGGNLGRHATDVPVLPESGEQTWIMHRGVIFGGRPSGGVEVSWDGDGPPLPDNGALDPKTPKVPKTPRSLGGIGDLQGRIGAWRALLDRPLTSYYLVLGITMLLLGLGLVMVQSTASVTDLIAGLSPYSDFKKQLLGAAIGLPLMWVAARSSPRLFRAFAYPLLAVAIVGLGLTLIHGVGVSQNGDARWISIGGQLLQPSEIA
jgi:hypothetical protein